MNDLARTAEVCERISAEIDRERAETQALRAELDDLIYDATHVDWFDHPRSAFPAKLRCGCRVTLDACCDGDSAWTDRRWHLCDAHEGLEP